MAFFGEFGQLVPDPLGELSFENLSELRLEPAFDFILGDGFPVDGFSQSLNEILEGVLLVHFEADHFFVDSEVYFEEGSLAHLYN